MSFHFCQGKIAIKQGLLQAYVYIVVLVKIRAKKAPWGKMYLFAREGEDMQDIAVVNEAWRKECSGGTS